MPLENSIHGTVTQVYAELLSHQCSIVKAHPVGISHCLLGIPGTKIGEITKFLSHEQALGQCANYIKNHNFEPVSIACAPRGNIGARARVFFGAWIEFDKDRKQPDSRKAVRISILPRFRRKSCRLRDLRAHLRALERNERIPPVRKLLRGVK